MNTTVTNDSVELSVLIVDDSKMVCDRLSELLRTLAGVTICGLAHSANSAIEFIQAHFLDVLILDVHMPGESGLRVLRKVKSDRPDTVVIVLTNYPFPQYARKYFAAGADYFLDKSNDFPKVLELIRHMRSIETTPPRA